MPITYEIDEHVGLVTLRFTGTVTDADLIAVSTRLYQDPRHRAGMAELSDCRGVERLEVTGKGLRRLAESTGLLLDQARTGWKSAIVVSGDLDFGLGRMYELLREASPEHVCVFRDFAAAERWLRQP